MSEPILLETVRVPGARDSGHDDDNVEDSAPTESDHMPDPDEDDEYDDEDEYPQTDIAADGALLCGGDDDPGVSLDDDPDTSMATSVQLHLMSEHGLANGTHLSYDAAQNLHTSLHATQRRHTHDRDDHRFRPGRCLDLIRDAVERERELTAALAAVGVEVAIERIDDDLPAT